MSRTALPKYGPSSYWVTDIRPAENRIHSRRASAIRLVPMIAARTPGVPQLRGAAASPEDVPEAVVAVTPLIAACFPCPCLAPVRLAGPLHCRAAAPFHQPACRPLRT